MPNGFDMGGALKHQLSRPQPVVDRVLEVSGFGVVMSQQFGLCLCDIGNRSLSTWATRW
jgi:hypothetical protein